MTAKAIWLSLDWSAGAIKGGRGVQYLSCDAQHCLELKGKCSYLFEVTLKDHFTFDPRSFVGLSLYRFSILSKGR